MQTLCNSDKNNCIKEINQFSINKYSIMEEEFDAFCLLGLAEGGRFYLFEIK